jgi:molybdopterin/thiamine biosynthesis adenylyltransferase/Zn ribbon nucleic-acid-binding protein
VIIDERYARLEAMPGMGADGVAALRDTTVAVLGLGNVGGQLAQHLVLHGIGVVLVDRDVVAEANLGTQGFLERDLGQSKAEARAERLAPLNPTCRIEPVHADIRQLGLGALHGVSLIFSCLDSRRSRVVVNEMAMRLGIPWIDGALDGSGASLFGRVASYDFRRPESACYLCPHDSTSLRDIANEGSVAGCSAIWWNDGAAAAPTLASSALGGAVASMQAIWGVRVLRGQCDESASTEMYFDVGRRHMSSHRLPRNPRCLLDHHSWPLRPLGRDTAGTTVAQTFAFAEAQLGGEIVLQLPQRSIVTAARCPQCGAEVRTYRVLDSLAIEGVHCVCGHEMHPAINELLDRFGRLEAKPFLDRTWREIGLPPADVVIAANGNRELHILLTE